MAASAGTNPGSMPDGVTDGVGVGDGESLPGGDAESEASGLAEPAGVETGAGLTAAAVHPLRMQAIMVTPRPRTIRRD